ncbi:uncharacterized protein [Solanum tuberosum]|uniref:uncharacterized protein n=1 Tax=Solanum tuberosum TaxID=4113 RepID=UPI00073A19DC|nr:PREDICTED: uncharacterized protein LOC107060451 [Solanum tuberosum]
MSSVAFSGHVVSGEGIRVEFQKIEVVKNWPRPTTPTEKTARFQWSDICERNFQELKDRLTTSPVLALPEGTEGYVVYCDASGKGNIVADALRRLSMDSLAYLSATQREVARDVHKLANLGVRLMDSEDGSIVVLNTVESSLVALVKERQYSDPILLKYKEGIWKHPVTPFELAGDGTLRCRGRLCVPDVDGLRQKIMDEAHCSCYSVHPGSTKMYHDLKEVYWWNDMKKDIVEYVAKWSNCQQVKAEHQRPGGLAQTISISVWKWEAIYMDFVTSLPSSFHKHVSIWVIID